MAVQRLAVVSFHTCPLEQPGTGDSGGLNVYVMSLANALARRGVQTDVFTRRASDQSSPVVLAAPGVRIFHVAAGESAAVEKDHLPLLGPAFIAGVAEIIDRRDTQYDAVHSHYWMSARAGRHIARRMEIPHVMTFHSLGHAKNSMLALGDIPEPGHRLLGETRAVAAADHVVASTESEATTLLSHYGACRNRISVIPPGVDTSLFSPGDKAESRKRTGFSSHAEEFTIVIAGRIQPLKGIDIAIAALAELQDDHRLTDRIKLVVVGGPSGPAGSAESEALKTAAQQLGVTSLVDFRSPIPQKELVHVYRGADLVVVPSRSESFGLVALEAQACGTPVVASSAGGLPEVVRDGVTGIVVESLTSKAFSAAIGKLLLDDGIRSSMSKTAAAHAAAFTWGSTAEKMLGLYEARELISAAENCDDEEIAESGTARWM